MSSNTITKTDEPIKSLEIKTKEEEKKLFKDDVLDKFNFWIYVAFIILGLVLLISFILLIYSIFSSYSSSSTKPPEPVIINPPQVPKVNINPIPVQIAQVKPVVNLPPPTPIPIIKKVEEPKPSFFSSWFGNSSKKTTTTTPTPTTPTTSNSNSDSLPKLNTSSTSSSITTTNTTTNTNNNKNSSIFSSFSNMFSSFSNRNNIPKPTDNKITGGRYIKRYKNYRNNYK